MIQAPVEKARTGVGRGGVGSDCSFFHLRAVASGKERIEYAPLGRLTREPYDDRRDMMWPAGSGEFLTVEPAEFMLLWPSDAHIPGIGVGEPAPVKKVVITIRLGEP